ncbi:MAG: hypothetical protein PWP23_30 [Candidatus Sumerlaeota bacterium]|nr:hypothetical protein [Candidatus Sumerlaeota bacterium]
MLVGVLVEKPTKKKAFGVVRGLVSGVRQWIDNADREDQEHRMELVKARPPDPLNPDGIQLDGQPAVPPPRKEKKLPPPTRHYDPSGTGGGTAPQQTFKTPPSTPSRHSKPLEPDYGPVAPQNPAGMRFSKEIRKQGNPDTGGLRVSRQNDTSYHERNKTVALVKERYAPYGHSIASAMLTKCLTPRGVVMLMERLELPSTGSEDGDHDLILEWIEDKGVEEFAKTLGLKATPAKLREEQRNHTIRSQERRRIVEEARERQGGTRGPAPKKRLLPASNQPRNSSPHLKKNDIKPISLPPEEPPAPE